MGWLQFLSRLSFICGFFFLLAISLRFKEWLSEEMVISTIITIGYIIGMIVVPLTCLCYLIMAFARVPLRKYIAGWLVAANFFFLLALLFYIFYLDDPYYHQ
jgi:hypothetical protein